MIAPTEAVQPTATPRPTGRQRHDRRRGRGTIVMTFVMPRPRPF